MDPDYVRIVSSTSDGNRIVKSKVVSVTHTCHVLKVVPPFVKMSENFLKCIHSDAL